MATVTSISDEQDKRLANANMRILQYEQKIAQMGEELAQCRAENARLREQLQFEQNLRKNSQASGQDKVVLAATLKEYNVVAKREAATLARPGRAQEGAKLAPMTVRRERIAQSAGCSVDAVTDSLKHLVSMGAIEKRTVYDRESGMSSMKIAFTPEALEDPLKLTYPEGEKPNTGGNRKKCSSCGSDDLVEDRVWTCRSCGQVVKKFDPRPVNPPIDEITPPAQENCRNGKLPYPEKFKVSTSPAKYHIDEVTSNEKEQVPAPRDDLRLSDECVAGCVEEVAETPERPDVTSVSECEGSVLPPRMGQRASRARQSTYYEKRPTPEHCAHPKNLVRKLGEDWYCSNCGGRNEELLKWGGAS